MHVGNDNKIVVVLILGIVRRDSSLLLFYGVYVISFEWECRGNGWCKIKSFVKRKHCLVFFCQMTSTKYVRSTPLSVSTGL